MFKGKPFWQLLCVFNKKSLHTFTAAGTRTPLVYLNNVAALFQKKNLLLNIRVTNSIVNYHVSSTCFKKSNAALKENISPDTEVFLYGVDDNELGIMTFAEAEIKAKESKTFLVVESKRNKNNTIVCKLLQSKKNKPQQTVKEKEVHVKENIEENHLQLKLDQTVKWLEKSYMVTAIFEHASKSSKKSFKDIVKRFTDIAEPLAKIELQHRRGEKTAIIMRPHVKEQITVQKPLTMDEIMDSQKKN